MGQNRNGSGLNRRTRLSFWWPAGRTKRSGCIEEERALGEMGTGEMGTSICKSVDVMWFNRNGEILGRP
jgi:hypothetical protein